LLALSGLGALSPGLRGKNGCRVGGTVTVWAAALVSVGGDAVFVPPQTQK
jgi:hypothetical protein